MVIEFDAHTRETTIEDVKKRAKGTLGIEETTQINLLEKRTCNVLNDKLELTMNSGKLYSRKSSLANEPKE